MTCQATQQGTCSRTPAGGLGLFRESPQARPPATQSPCRDPAPTENKKIIEGTEGLKEHCCSVEDAWGPAGLETYFLQCQRAEESHTPKIHSAWSTCCPHPPLLAWDSVRNRRGGGIAPFLCYKKHARQMRSAHLPPWSTRHTWDG